MVALPLSAPHVTPVDLSSWRGEGKRAMAAEAAPRATRTTIWLARDEGALAVALHCDRNGCRQSRYDLPALPPLHTFPAPDSTTK